MIKTVLLAGCIAGLLEVATSGGVAQATQTPLQTQTSVVAVKAMRLPADLKLHKEAVGLKPALRYRVEMVLHDGNGRITMGDLSGLRSREEQQHMIDLHAQGLGAPADPIDESAHVTGEGADLQVKAGDEDFRDLLCKRWGLIQTHKNERWHWELDPKAVGF